MTNAPDWKDLVRRRIPLQALPAARAADIRAEIAQMLEDTWDEALAAGATPDEALARAMAQLPDGAALARWIEEEEQPVTARVPPPLRPGALGDRLATSRRGAGVHALLQDLKYALRTLTARRGFTAIAGLTLALGIGANTAIFTLVNEALLRPRPGIGEPGRLVDIGRSDRGEGFDNMSYPNFRDYRERAQRLEGAAALLLEPRPMSLGTAAGSERLYANLVSGNYFDVLQVRPGLGRFFLPEEDRTEGSHPVAVLSHAFWQQRFQGDRGIVGRALKLNGIDYTVTGIAPAGFHGTTPLAVDAWIPMMMAPLVMASPGILECRDCSVLAATGRLKPGATLAEARAEAQAISASLQEEHPREVGERGIAVVTSRLIPGELVGMVAAFLGLLMAIVGLVLVIASVNVAGMMLVRATTRRREIAVRLAMGARRGDIVRQFLVEGLVLFLAGGAAGILLAAWMRDALLALLPALPVPVVVRLDLDGRVLLFALGLSLLAGTVASLVPALQAARPDLTAALKDDSQTGGFRRLRLRTALVLGQVALSLVLLVCAGLFLRALDRAARVDPGFDMQGLHVLSMDLSLAGLKEAEGIDFAERFAGEVRALPGVTGAAWAWSVPLDGGGRGLGAFQVPGTTSPEGGDQWEFDWSVVTPGYFDTMKIPLLAGRDFAAQDDAAAATVAIVNEYAARSVWPGQDPIGRTFRFGDPRDPASMRTAQVIGVARDQKYRSLGDPPRRFVFLPLRQQYIDTLALMVRTPSAPTTLPAIRKALRATNPGLPIVNALPIQEYAAIGMLPQTIAGWVSGLLGMVGLLLVGLGVYGVTAFSVEQRTREVGIRMALGAGRRDVLRMVLAQGLRLAGWGVAIGLVLAAGAAQLLASLLYGVGALDPVTFVAVPALVLAVAALATALPARRATRIDPLVALRHE